jgi:hypothetical protein
MDGRNKEKRRKEDIETHYTAGIRKRPFRCERDRRISTSDLLRCAERDRSNEDGGGDGEGHLNWYVGVYEAKCDSVIYQWDM